MENFLRYPDYIPSCQKNCICILCLILVCIFCYPRLNKWYTIVYIILRRLYTYPKRVKNKKIEIQPIINNTKIPITVEDDDDEGLPPGDDMKLD